MAYGNCLPRDENCGLVGHGRRYRRRLSRQDEGKSPFGSFGRSGAQKDVREVAQAASRLK